MALALREASRNSSKLYPGPLAQARPMEERNKMKKVIAILVFAALATCMASADAVTYGTAGLFASCSGAQTCSGNSITVGSGSNNITLTFNGISNFLGTANPPYPDQEPLGQFVV